GCEGIQLTKRFSIRYLRWHAPASANLASHLTRTQGAACDSSRRSRRRVLGYRRQIIDVLRSRNQPRVQSLAETSIGPLHGQEILVVSCRVVVRELEGQ